MMTLHRVLRTARRTIVSILVTGSVAVAVAGQTGTQTATVAQAPAHATRSVASAYAASPALDRAYYEKRVQYWINVRRHEHGLSALKLATCTDAVADKWGSYLAATDSFYHQSMGTIMNKCNAYYAGETLGRGSITPKRLIYLWMHSPEHRAVLLSHYPRRVGIGAFPNSRGEWVVAADFMKF